ncbi:ribose ABC transporter substrate-binding protein RbsB [Fastidiosibacter lacustris]|uniref:ribose ABC transporter substrate-binding protein RbsB n=1 Tax=Fastidiosibacter lacustris TaxID=2056695 RepID=UPI001EFEB2BC|nr:ribose ABC transporter substrate-binding protein RbsB [Fastidiosibacter lacustris]
MKNKIMKYVSLIIGIFSILILAGCGNSNDNSKTIGLVVSTLDNPFFVSMKSGAEETAKAEGYKVIVLDSRNDPSKELSNVQDLVTRNIKVIIINPTDSQAVSNAVKYANQHNVEVITLDRTAVQGKVLSHVESNNVVGGKMAAQYMIERLNDSGKIIELEGIPGTSAAKERGKGFEDEIANSGITIVAKQPANFDRTQGLNVTQNLLQANPDINGIFAQNDEMALGAIRAVEEAGKKRIIIIGFDGTKEAINAVKAGKMTASIAQQPYLMGELGVEAAIKFLVGQKVNPHIVVPLRLVTQSNA